MMATDVKVVAGVKFEIGDRKYQKEWKKEGREEKPGNSKGFHCIYLIHCLQNSIQIYKKNNLNT